MRVAVCTIAYNEARFIKPFLQHIPTWVDEKVVLLSVTPWLGEDEKPDKTEQIAHGCGATVITHDWPTEEAQRNAGQEYLSDYDWIVWLDPDEFLDKNGWNCIKQIISASNVVHYTKQDNGIMKFDDEKAFIVNHQRVFWKDKEVSPHTDYQQLILTKPEVRFTEKRVVDCAYSTLPITLYHFSWARTDKEVWSKVSHYSHANEMDIKKWYNEVWLADKKTDLHPMTPETLKALIEPNLPNEIGDLKLWPNQKYQKSN